MMQLARGSFYSVLSCSDELGPGSWNPPLPAPPCKMPQMHHPHAIARAQPPRGPRRLQLRAPRHIKRTPALAARRPNSQPPLETKCACLWSCELTGLKKGATHKACAPGWKTARCRQGPGQGSGTRGHSLPCGEMGPSPFGPPSEPDWPPWRVMLGKHRVRRLPLPGGPVFQASLRPAASRLPGRASPASELSRLPRAGPLGVPRLRRSSPRRRPSPQSRRPARGRRHPRAQRRRPRGQRTAGCRRRSAAASARPGRGPCWP